MCVVVIVYDVDGRVLLVQGTLVNDFGHSRVDELAVGWVRVQLTWV